MKTSQVALAVVGIAFANTTTFGFTEFARGELILSTTARGLYDSRIFGGAHPADDYIFTLDPNLIYRREAGQIKMEALTGVRINRYADYTEFNSEDFSASVKLRLPAEGASLASGVFESSYDEHTDVNDDVSSRLREKSFLTRLGADIPTGLKTVLLLGGTFRRDLRNGFSDRDSWDGSIGYRYQNFLGGSAFDIKYRKLKVTTSGENELDVPLDQSSDIYSATFSRPLYHDVRGGITYGYRVLDRSRAEVLTPEETRSEGSFINLNINGPFLPKSMFPKVDSSLSLGYQKNESPGLHDTSSTRFIGSLHLDWEARERTKIFLDARRSQVLSVNDLTVTSTGFTVGLNQSIGNFTTASLSTGYEKREYKTLVPPERDDDVFLLQASAHYRITRSWSAGANYRLRETQSNLAVSDYTRHLVSVEATYAF